MTNSNPYGLLVRVMRLELADRVAVNQNLWGKYKQAWSSERTQLRTLFKELWKGR